MAVIGINVYDTKKFISRHDTDKENPTTWEIGVLDSLLKAKVKDGSTVFEYDPQEPSNSKAKTTLNINQSNIDIVRFGLKGVENFIDPRTKKPVEFNTIAITRSGKSYNVVTDEILRMIPPPILDELAKEINKNSDISGEEEKN